MRKSLLATTATAVALMFPGSAFAQADHTLFSPRKFVQDQSQTSQSPAPAGEKAAAPAAAELSPIGQQLKELIETKLQQYLPREHDRTGVLAFYRNRNF